MPLRNARPRTRPRRLEGIERMHALVEVVVSPCLVGNEANQRRELRRIAALWIELRDEVIAEGRDLTYHWCYQALELEADPSPFLDAHDDTPEAWVYGVDDWPAQRAAMIAQQARAGVMAREEYAALMGTA